MADRTITVNIDHTASMNNSYLAIQGEQMTLDVVLAAGLWALGYDGYVDFLLPDGSAYFKGPYDCSTGTISLTLGVTDSILDKEGKVHWQFVLSEAVLGVRTRKWLSQQYESQILPSILAETAAIGPYVPDMVVPAMYPAENVSVADVAGNFNGTNVETVLAGLANGLGSDLEYQLMIMRKAITATTEGIEYRGAMALFKEKFANPSVFEDTMEISLVPSPDDSDILAWWQSSYSDVSYAYSSDADVHVWTQVGVVLATCRWMTVFTHGAYYYMLGLVSGSICIWRSSNKTSWTKLNSNNPIISATTGIWTNVWNTTIIVIDDDIHVWIECGLSADQSDVGLGYTHGTIADLSLFETNKSSVHVIPHGGNPCGKYVPERSAFLILHGDIYDDADDTAEKNYWTIRATTCASTADFSDPASYALAPKSRFYVYQAGVHVTDPEICALPASKNSKTIFFYGTGQLDLWQSYSDSSIKEIYDSIVYL